MKSAILPGGSFRVPVLLLFLVSHYGSTRASDVVSFAILEGQHYTQLPVSGFDPVPDSTGQRWRTEVHSAASDRVLSASVGVPGGAEIPLTAHGRYWWVQEDFSTESAREAAFPDGAYRLRFRAVTDGEVTVTSVLPTMQPPPVARIASSETLLAINGREDLTLVWSLTSAAPAPEVIQVSVLDPLDEPVFRTPDPGQPGALAGSATQTVIPRAVWRTGQTAAGGTGLFRIQVATLRIGALETAAVPGAIGYVGRYRATTISAMVTEIPACGDVEHFDVLLGRVWRQDEAGAVVPAAPGSDVFLAEAAECLARGIVGARVISPNGSSLELRATGDGSFNVEDAASSASELANRHPPGSYTVEIEGRQYGSRRVVLTLAGGSPSAPRVANWDVLQAPDYSEPVKIELATEAGARPDDVLELRVIDPDGRTVHAGPGWWMVDATLAGNTALLTIPRGILDPSRAYEARVRAVRRDSIDNAGFPAATWLGGSFAETRFPIGTRSPWALAKTFGVSTPGALPDLELGLPVVFAFAARAGTLPIAWSLGSGALPDGIELDAVSGDLLGIPSRTGTFDFVVRVRDAEGRMAERACKVHVTGTPRALKLEPATLPPGTGLERYLGVLAAAGGVGPLTWRMASDSGPLPRGLALDAEAGLITGIPEESGSFPIRVTVGDRVGQTVTGVMTLTVPAFVSPPGPRIAGFRSVDGVRRFGLTGAEPGSYVVEASEDLRSWLPVASTDEVPIGEWEFADPAAGPRRFYRARTGVMGEEAHPVNVRAAVDPARSVSATLSDPSTSLVVTNREGIVFELTLPPGALWSPEAVRMTVVTSVSDLPADLQFVAAVSLEPDGLLLRRPGTLTIRFPGEVPADVTAFGAQGLGEDWHFVRADRSGAAVVLRVPHFTMFGTGRNLRPEATVPAGCQYEATVSHVVEVIARQPDLHGTAARWRTALTRLFVDWFDGKQGVRPLLKRASRSESALLGAWSEFQAWNELLSAIAEDPRLRALNTSLLVSEMAPRAAVARALLAVAFRNAFREVEERCRKKKAIAEAFRLRAEIQLARDVVSQGLCEPVFDWAALEERLAALLRCEVAFRSTVVVDGGNYFSSASVGTGRERAVLRWNPGTDTWSGEPVHVGLEQWIYADDAGTENAIAREEHGGFRPLEVRIDWHMVTVRNPDNDDCYRLDVDINPIGMVFRYSPHANLDFILLPKKVPPKHTGEDFFWRGPYSLAMKEYESGGGVLADEGWEWTLVGQRFARWRKSVPSGDVTATTTLDLYYAPK